MEYSVLGTLCDSTYHYCYLGTSLGTGETLKLAVVRYPRLTLLACWSLNHPLGLLNQ